MIQTKRRYLYEDHEKIVVWITEVEHSLNEYSKLDFNSDLKSTILSLKVSVIFNYSVSSNLYLIYNISRFKLLI